MLYLVLCVWDIVAEAGACQSIIPAAIFGLLRTFLLTTYVWQWYLCNTWLSLFYLPNSCCIWYYVSGTLLLRLEHARALFLWPYLDSCGPFCSQHIFGNDICLIHDYCQDHVQLRTLIRLLQTHRSTVTQLRSSAHHSGPRHAHILPLSATLGIRLNPVVTTLPRLPCCTVSSPCPVYIFYLVVFSLDLTYFHWTWPVPNSGCSLSALWAVYLSL